MARLLMGMAESRMEVGQIDQMWTDKQACSFFLHNGLTRVNTLCLILIIIINGRN